MGKYTKLAEALTSPVVDWLRSLKRKGNVYMSPEEMYEEVGEKAEKLMTEAPQMFQYYEPMPVFQALREASEGSSDLVLMPPPTFRELARPIPEEVPGIKEEAGKTISEYQDKFRGGQMVRDIPYLSYYDPALSSLDTGVRIATHDGRHKTRALEGLRDPVQLVRMIPESDRVRLLRDIDPDTKVYSEKFYHERTDDEKPIGALGQLMRLLGIGAAPTAALSTLGGENGT